MVTNKENSYLLHGTAKVEEKGQIVTPKQARAEFDLNPGEYYGTYYEEKR